MSFTRARALRNLRASLQHSGVRATPRLSAPSRAQLAVTKRFASGGGAHGHAEPSSDIPWLVGGIAVTIPACWYLWPEASHAEHHDAHGEEAHDGEEEDASAEEEAPEGDSESKDDEKEDKSDDKEEDKSDDNEEGKSDDEPKDKPESKDEKSEPKDEGDDEEDADDDESSKSESGKGGSDKSGVGKGKGKNLDDTRKREPDSKGGFKKRIDSGLGKDLGKGSDFADSSDDEPNRENAATAKQPQKGKAGEISGKQFGLSTTATRHSTQIDEDPEKSKKGEGTPETAKSMGTVDVNRPAR